MTGLQADKILVPFDFSDACVEAVQKAISIVAEGGQVHVAHVMMDFYPVHPSELFPDFNEQEFKAKTQEKMERMILEADMMSDDLILDVVIGDPGLEIVNLAEELAVSLIVIPSHGRRGIKRLLLGSVAERVVRMAPCPILVLKEKPESK